MNLEEELKKTNEYKLGKLRNDFQNIQLILEEINESKIILLEKINQSKNIYQDLIKNNNSNLFIFCLDSLHFQYKLSLMDYESIKNNLSFIMNRMYCDYYKLYNIIFSEIHERKWISIQHVVFPKYNDLDILQEYKLENIIEIHNEILNMLDKLYYRFKELNNGVCDYTTHQKSVVCISNFLNTLKFENVLLENQIMLYINYISFFHYTQKKTLVRLYSKMTEFNKHIDEYTNIHNVISIDDINTEVSDDANARRMTNDFYNDENNIQLCNSPLSEITENNSANDKNNKDSPLFKIPVHSLKETPFESYNENVIMSYYNDSSILNQEPVNEVVKESVKEHIEESIKESVEEPVEEVVEEPVEEVVEKLVEEPVKEPVKEPVEEPIKELIEELTVQLEEHLIPKENIGLIEDIKLATLNYDTEEEEYEIKIGMIEDYYESPFPVELENTTHTF